MWWWCCLCSRSSRSCAMAAKKKRLSSAPHPYDTETSVTFHGTGWSRVPSILANGFLPSYGGGRHEAYRTFGEDHQTSTCSISNWLHTHRMFGLVFAIFVWPGRSKTALATATAPGPLALREMPRIRGSIDDVARMQEDIRDGFTSSQIES